MADEDIYGNKRRYFKLSASWERVLARLSPEESSRPFGRRKYFCQSNVNLKYFEELDCHFQARDTSYVRRLRVIQVLLFITHHTGKDLADCMRADVDAVVARAHEVYLTPASKMDFLKSLKLIWKVLFPVLDSEGRPDETQVPHPVRHLSCRVEKSRDRRRNDKLSFEEVKKLIAFFATNSQMQAYVTLALESLARPQEISYLRVGDVELHDGYARVWVSSHGKEGTKFLQCIDSYPYLLRWLEHHPHQRNPEAFLFNSDGERNRPLAPNLVNKHLRRACRRLGIERRITAYSLKRNGVTLSRLRGDSDLEIQHRAGWTSTKQLQTYDLSSPEDSFAGELAKRGLVSRDEVEVRMETKTCPCGAQVGFADRLCRRCKRVVAGQRGMEVRAEPVVRQMLALALENPELSLAEVLERWGTDSAPRKGVVHPNADDPRRANSEPLRGT